MSNSIDCLFVLEDNLESAFNIYSCLKDDSFDYKNPLVLYFMGNQSYDQMQIAKDLANWIYDKSRACSIEFVNLKKVAQPLAQVLSKPLGDNNVSIENLEEMIVDYTAKKIGNFVKNTSSTVNNVRYSTLNNRLKFMDIIKYVNENNLSKEVTAYFIELANEKVSSCSDNKYNIKDMDETLYFYDKINENPHLFAVSQNLKDEVLDKLKVYLKVISK